MYRSTTGSLPRLLVVFTALAVLTGACSNPTGPALSTMTTPAGTTAPTCTLIVGTCNP